MTEARTITRRGLILAGGAALGTAALPGAIVEAFSAESPSMAVSGAAAFDPAAFVADLQAAGFSVIAMRSIPQPGWGANRPAYCIGPGSRSAFGGRRYLAVMARWSDAMDACPDHVDRVVAHVLEQGSQA